MSVRSRTSRPAWEQRRRVSRRERPASMRTRAPGASTKTQFPALPLDRTQRRTRSVPPRCNRACSRSDRQPTSADAVLERRDAAFEKERQASQQGEAEGAEAPPDPPRQEPAEGAEGPLAAGMAETARPARRRGDLRGFAQLRADYRGHHQLGDALPSREVDVPRPRVNGD